MEKRVKLTKNRVPYQNTYFFTESSLRTIEAAMNQVSVKATQMIFTKEDLVESLFYIKSGEVKLYKVTKEGKEFVLTILSSGDMFGEVDSFTANSYAANAKGSYSSWEKRCYLFHFNTVSQFLWGKRGFLYFDYEKTKEW